MGKIEISIQYNRMYTITIPTPLGRFLFMGCWNRDGCQKEGGQARVAAAIRKEPAEYPLFLGGDNVYPDKDPATKQKTYSSERLTQGIRCLLRDSPRSLFAAIGNHNLPLLPTELQLAQQGIWILPSPSYRIQYSNSSIVVVDSNPLDEGRGEEVLETLATELNNLRVRGTPYYLIMHHPIISYKKKGVQLLPQHAALLDLLIQYPPIMILVADTHNYQKGIIEWKGTSITQVVSGTGGADLDPIDYVGPIEGFDGSYTLLEHRVAYGYQRITEDQTEFVEVRSGGYRTRRHTTARLAGQRRKKRTYRCK